MAKVLTGSFIPPFFLIFSVYMVLPHERFFLGNILGYGTWERKDCASCLKLGDSESTLDNFQVLLFLSSTLRLSTSDTQRTEANCIYLLISQRQLTYHRSVMGTDVRPRSMVGSLRSPSLLEVEEGSKR